MRVLFAISLVALAGLLWASFAAARHIRKARKRRRLARANAAMAQAGRREEALAGPQPSKSLERLLPSMVAPPPPVVLDDAEWDDLVGLDPLSEVTRSFSPRIRAESPRRRLEEGLVERVGGATPCTTMHLEISSDADPAGACVPAPLGRDSTLPKSSRLSRTPSLPAHG